MYFLPFLWKKLRRILLFSETGKICPVVIALITEDPRQEFKIVVFSLHLQIWNLQKKKKKKIIFVFPINLLLFGQKEEGETNFCNLKLTMNNELDTPMWLWDRCGHYTVSSCYKIINTKDRAHVNAMKVAEYNTTTTKDTCIFIVSIQNDHP